MLAQREQCLGCAQGLSFFKNGNKIRAFDDIIAVAEINPAPLWGVGGIFAPSSPGMCIFVLCWQQARFYDCFIGCPLLLSPSVFFPLSLFTSELLFCNQFALLYVKFHVPCVS